MLNEEVPYMREKKLTRKRWLILIVCSLANLCLGSIYSWSVFAAPLGEYLSKLNHTTITSADLAIVYTVANSVGPITMITGGWFNDKFGPKKVILIGGIMFGLGMLLSGFSTSIPYLIISYGLLCGLGLGMDYGCIISTCVKFFPDKRGLIGGISTAAYGMSSVILPPIAAAIISVNGISFAFIFLGIIFTVILIICSLVIEKCPDSFIPAGWTPNISKCQTQIKNYSWKSMLKMPIFYIMLFLLLCGAFSGMMIISQASSIASNLVGIASTAASLSVSILALFNVTGRLMAGYLSDKIGRINMLTISNLLSILGLFILWSCGLGNIVKFHIGVSLVGFCFGSFMGIYPGFTADQFGSKNNSVNYGIMFIGFALAGFFGPTIMKTIYSITGHYNNSFLVAILLSASGALLTIIYRIMNRKSRLKATYAFHAKKYYGL